MTFVVLKVEHQTEIVEDMTDFLRIKIEKVGIRIKTFCLCLCSSNCFLRNCCKTLYQFETQKQMVQTQAVGRTDLEKAFVEVTGIHETMKKQKSYPYVCQIWKIELALQTSKELALKFLAKWTPQL
ncbi:hypothetical protein COP1_006746 [Malus domestica]